MKADSAERVRPVPLADMRVVAGIAGGLRLQAPPGRHLRPTTERVREAMFSSLESMAAVRGARAIDLFAGTGALGIEALSRGAASVTFIDADHVAIGMVKANLASTHLEGATTIQSDAIRFVENTAERFDLALVAPPYAFDDWDRLLASVPADLVALEWGRVVILPPGWDHVRTLTHGDSVVTLARRHGIVQTAPQQIRPMEQGPDGGEVAN